MWHGLLRDSRFFETLGRFDEDLAEQARAAGCRRCGGRLHRAHYPRKPRGGPAELELLPIATKRRKMNTWPASSDSLRSGWRVSIAGREAPSGAAAQSRRRP